MAASIAIIGGADGPTSIFVAGKVGDGSVIALLVAGGILLVLAAVLFFRHRT
ncbi:MAG: sodium ion-translocating decarboxylase subunit beta [Lachnospiraceae bacterium]|nr:sodium ion-translocating decarboxylase subunit beta [Lachnospiraceae bacterium]